MKTARKVLLLVLCAALLVSASVMGTIAYLTDNDAVVNTFTVGKVQIVLNEKDTDNDANTDDNVTVDGVVRDCGNDYKLYPGKSYEKDPTIFVDANSEDCWLFVKVENGIADIEADTNKIAAQLAANGWTLIEGEGVYARTATNKAGDSVKVFETFEIAETVDNDTLAKYGEATITVTAYAVQAAGFDTAAAAWGAAEAELTA